jgi:hypothetical protein
MVLLGDVGGERNGRAAVRRGHSPDVMAGEPVVFEPGLPRHLLLSVSLGWGR